MSDTVRIENKQLLGKSWGRLDNYTVTHRRRDGAWQTVTREVYDHGHATAILLFDPAARTVVLTRQFRLPPHLNGDAEFLLEAPAGMLDGQEPAIAAAREAQEETGFTASGLELVAHVYASPGALTEKCACFIARYSAGTQEGGGGLADEGEDIEVVEMDVDQAIAMIATGGIADAKTVILLQALALRLAAQ